MQDITKDFLKFLRLLNAHKVRYLIVGGYAVGFDGNEYSPAFFMKPDNILMIGREPWRIDLFTTIKGLDFKKIYGNRVEYELNGIKIPFVGKADLIVSKKASNRDRNRDDIRRLTTNDKLGE